MGSREQEAYHRNEVKRISEDEGEGKTPGDICAIG